MDLLVTVFLKVLPLNGGAEVENGVVYQIRGVLGEVQNHEVEVQSDDAAFPRQNSVTVPMNQIPRKKQQKVKKEVLPFPPKIQDDLRQETDCP